MNKLQYEQLFSFMYGIANDVLVDKFEAGEYKNIILPMITLRRLDLLLEPTKQKVLNYKKKLDEKGITNQDAFLFKETGLPYYNTSNFTLKTLQAENDESRLKINFIDYLNGFSKDVLDIIDKFKLRASVDTMSDKGILGLMLEKITSEKVNLGIKPVLDEGGKEKLPALDNHTMGTLFERLLRQFNEDANVVAAGRHFTPRDYVKLLAELAIVPVADKLEDNTYTIYDGACGTGGILTIAEERIQELAKELGKNIKTNIFGQELLDATYATCKSDLMLMGNRKSFQYQLGGVAHEYIVCGSTISQDGHPGQKFDFCISNPPFGTPWKNDLENWGYKDKKEIVDKRFVIDYAGNSEYKMIPDIGDPQMLFLANNVSRMKSNTKLGTRIVEIHNGSSLYNGDAGSGNSNLRRYLFENDLVEAIIAMPEKQFYNTGIGTFVWVLSNRKEEKRKGKVQLIDATQIFTPLRKNLGEKNCETNASDRDKILKLFLDFEENENSKIFDNKEFGYWQVPILRPEKDENGKPVLDKKGHPKMKKERNEFEQIPLLYEGGIEAFYKNEVKPYDSEVQFGESEIGYEVSFTKYFYKPVELRKLSSIRADIEAIEKETAGMLTKIFE
ncbi:MAG: SAM-dependent DNA methyltransferase [Bacteroidales bacterium]|nr:SAM-dependent DNA methyltransferase [Bacteroidales bacterium]